MPPENIESPGATPVDVQATPPEDNSAPEKGTGEVAKLRAECAKYRTKYSAANERIAALEKAQAEAARRREVEDEARARTQGDFQKLYENQASVLATAKSKLVESEIRSRLARAGVVDEKQQAFILPALRDKLSVEVGDDFSVTGDFESVITEAVDLLGLRQARTTPEPAAPATPKPVSPAALMIAQTLPQGEKKSADDALSQFKAALLS